MVREKREADEKEDIYRKRVAKNKMKKLVNAEKEPKKERCLYRNSMM